MGQNCIKPNNLLKDKYTINKCNENISQGNQNNINSEQLNEKISNLSLENSDYQNRLKAVLIRISQTYFEADPGDGLTPRTNRKRIIDENGGNESVKIPRFDELLFFENYYSMEELEEYLEYCSTISSASSNGSENEVLSVTEAVNLNDEYNKILLGGVKVIDSFTLNELEDWTIKKKLHLELCKKEIHLKKLTRLLIRVIKNTFIEKVIDLTGDCNNAAISIALLNNNIKAFYFLLKTCQASLPLYIYEQDKKLSFLIYVAKRGKIKEKRQGDSVEYILFTVLQHLFSIHPTQDITDHMTLIDEDTKMSLPHFLLNIYSKSHELRGRIIDCFVLCIKNCPECIDVMCVNCNEPQYLFNVIANSFSQPNIDVTIYQKFAAHLISRLHKDDKGILTELIRVHRDRKKQDSLLALIG